MKHAGFLALFVLSACDSPPGSATAPEAFRSVPRIAMALDPSDDLGYQVCAAGDLDADGVPDFILLTAEKTVRAAITAYSGREGRVLWSIEPAEPDKLRVRRRSFCVIGDVTADGVADLVVAVDEYNPPKWITHEEWIECWDGRSHALVWRRRPDDVTLDLALLQPGVAYGGNYFGPDFIVVGDIDRDGAQDFAMVSANRDNAQYQSGALGVYSGRTGLRLDSAAVGAPEKLYGSLEAYPDIDGDGIKELLTVSEAEKPELRSGRNGSFLRELPSMWRSGLVRDAGPVPDFDGDGVPEIAVQSVGTDLFENEHSRWLFCSPRTGKVVERTRPGSWGLQFVNDARTGAPVMWTLTSTGLEGRAVGSETVLASLELGKDLEGSLVNVGDVDRDGQADLLLVFPYCASRLFGLENSIGEALTGADLEAQLAAANGPVLERSHAGKSGLVLLVSLPQGLADR